MLHFPNLIETIKIRRQSLKVNQELLSELSGISLRTLKQFESGKGNPTLKTIEKLAGALGLELTLKVKSLSSDKWDKRRFFLRMKKQGLLFN